MSFFTNRGIKIAGMTAAVPQNKVTVDSFSDVFGDEVTGKFSDVTGIREMYKALPEQTASDLAVAAAQELFGNVKVDRNEIGLTVLVTQSPDYRRPSSVSVVQKRLGLNTDCACMEINLGCSGFIYGMQTVMSLMSASDMKYALLLMGETASKLVSPNDKSIAMMYGDAGAAVLLEKTDYEACTETLLCSDGSRYKAIILPAGAFRDMNPSRDTFVCRDGTQRSLYDIHMDGTEVFSFSINEVPKAVKDFMEHTKKSADDYDSFVFHQANGFIIKQLIRKLGLRNRDVPISIDRYGNTGGISVPLTMCDAYGKSEASIKRVLMTGFGIGLSWGVMSLSVETDALFPIVSTADYFAEGKITGDML